MGGSLCAVAVRTAVHLISNILYLMHRLRSNRGARFIFKRGLACKYCMSASSIVHKCMHDLYPVRSTFRLHQIAGK